MDHFGVARRHARADAALGLRHHHGMAPQGERPTDGESDHAGADDEDVAHDVRRITG